MTEISRTAYPRFKSEPNPKELAEFYTPTEAEIDFARSQTANKAGRFCLLLLLKAFQRLGYFPDMRLFPPVAIEHLRKLLNLPAAMDAIAPLRSQRRYEQAVRSFLNVKIFDANARIHAALAITKAATIMDRPADLINVAIEELVKESYELPAFSTLDRLAKNIRSITNQRLFNQISSKLTTESQIFLDNLLSSQLVEGQVSLNLLKSPPKSAKLSHIIQLQTKFDGLMSFGNAQQLLTGIAKSKIQSFAAQAKAFDISDFRDVKHKKRYALLVCLLYQSQVKTRDYLVELFLKRMRKIQYRARQRLIELREQHRKQTEDMMGLLIEVLEASVENSDATIFGTQAKSLFELHGGDNTLLENCHEFNAYNSDNYFPLVRHFFSRYRKLLFDLVRSLDLQSTSQDLTLTQAVTWILNQEERRSKFLPDEIDLSFISPQWRQLVVEQQEKKVVFVRTHLEVCIFTYLAAELRSGDVCVAGSDKYADFREQLLDWEDCQSQLAEFGAQSGLPVTATSFVAALQLQLTEVAQTVDGICQDGSQVTISADGVPVLKRLTAKVKPLGADKLETEIWERLPERSVLEILCNVEHWLNWTRQFGLASGSEAKLEQSTERYILTVYNYIDPLFTEVADWKLIETHWQDLIRVALSIKAGKLMPSTVLRRLGSNSRKNRLYQAFQALGKVIRTLFLLQYISDRALRQEITACTNIVEGYHNFLDWVFFAKQGVITDQDPEEQEKRLKYLDLVASAVILHNTVDISKALRGLVEEGYKVDRDLLATLSPYLTRNLKRYGDYVVDMTAIPDPFDLAVNLPINISES